MADFDRFDWILAMDTQNLTNILSLARNTQDEAKVHLFRDFEPDNIKGRSVPDPYYERNFGVVFDICKRGCVGLLDQMGFKN